MNFNWHRWELAFLLLAIALLVIFIAENVLGLQVTQ